ncbi:Cytochrome B5-like protein [Linum grandiflorum]
MMVIAVVVLILGVLLGAMFLLPFKSAVAEKGRPNANKVKAFKVYNKAEISLHNKRTDCWIIVKDRVFDVTSYVEEHPGGDAILTNAGDDSTQGFFGPQHPGGAFQLIEDYCIGELEK